MHQHPSTITCTADGIFIWPGIRVASRVSRRHDQEICNLLACFHGPEVLRSDMVTVIRRAADLYRDGLLEQARRCLQALSPLRISASGKILMREISSRLGVAMPLLPMKDDDQFAPLSLMLARKIGAGFDSVCEQSRGLAPIFCGESLETLHKDWEPEQHPRVGEGQNPGWFATVEHQPNAQSTGSAIPVTDFSDGFHDVVVDAWVAALNAAGPLRSKHRRYVWLGPVPSWAFQT